MDVAGALRGVVRVLCLEEGRDQAFRRHHSDRIAYHELASIFVPVETPGCHRRCTVFSAVIYSQTVRTAWIGGSRKERQALSPSDRIGPHPPPPHATPSLFPHNSHLHLHLQRHYNFNLLRTIYNILHYTSTSYLPLLIPLIIPQRVRILLPLPSASPRTAPPSIPPAALLFFPPN